MFTVYVLYSDSHDRIYIGVTANLEARIAAHNHPLNKGWTKRYQPWRLVYSEVFPSKSDALARERQLKQHAGRNFIRSLIKSWLVGLISGKAGPPLLKALPKEGIFIISFLIYVRNLTIDN